MDVDEADKPADAERSRISEVAGGATMLTMAQSRPRDVSDSNAPLSGVLARVEPALHVHFAKAPYDGVTDASTATSLAEPAFPGGQQLLHDETSVNDPSMSDSAFAASMASFTSDLQAELSRLSSGQAASLYFSPQDTTATTGTTGNSSMYQSQCASCLATLEMAIPDAYAATAATFCLCCGRPLLVPGIGYVQEEDALFPRCSPCMLARLPSKPIVEEDWWPAQYKHALLRAVETKLWRKLIDVGNLPQSGESARHQLYHRRHQLENAQSVHASKLLDAVRHGGGVTDESFDALFREWRDLQVREDAENFRIIVLLSKCLQGIGRGVPAEVGEALQLCRGRDIRGELLAAKQAASLLTPVSCGCCPAVLTIPAPSGVPLPNACFCFCCARMVPESLMYQPENASKPTDGDLCLDCAAAHDDLERKWFLASASPTMVDWRRHKVAMGLVRQLKRVRNSTALVYKGGCESDKDMARWRVADGAATQWQSRSDKIMSEHRVVLRRGWTPVAESRQCYAAQVELETKLAVAIPPLLKILANLLVRQRIAVGVDDVHIAMKRSDSMDEPRPDERNLKYRKF